MALPQLERANAFWSEMSVCEHFVQIYESEEVFMDILASFVSEALKEDHTAVVIATPAHRQLVADLVKMVRQLGILALAEGIEVADEAATCVELGFDLAQGFYFGRPTPMRN